MKEKSLRERHKEGVLYYPFSGQGHFFFLFSVMKKKLKTKDTVERETKQRNRGRARKFY